MCAQVVAQSAEPGLGWARNWVRHSLDSEAELSCLRTHGQSSLQRGVHCRGVFLGATIAASRAFDPANWVAVLVLGFLSAQGIERGGWDEVRLSSLFLLVQAC